MKSPRWLPMSLGFLMAFGSGAPGQSSDNSSTISNKAEIRGL
jgi:hypothetical protein